MSLISYRKDCVGERQVYRRIANEKVKLFKQLIVFNSPEHNQIKNVKHDKIGSDYNQSEEIVCDNTSVDDINTLDNECTENQFLNLSYELENVVNDIGDVVNDIEDENTPDLNLRDLIKH